MRSPFFQLKNHKQKGEKNPMSIKRYDSDTKELKDVAGVYRLEGGGASVEVDDELSTLSENPVKNKVITGELNKKLTEVSVMPENPTDKQTVLFVGATAGEYVKGTIYEYSESESKWNPISIDEIEVDDSLDSTSENPVQNKVIVSAMGAKQPIQLVSAITLESHAYDTVPTALSALATRLEDTYKKNQVDTAMNAKQPVQLVSAMILESNPYTTVPTALGALATRLEDTYTKNETDLKTAGLLNPKGTVTFVNLPTLSAAEVGDMYNVSDAFVTTSDFMEGAGEYVPAGANVYKTSSDKWDVLAGSPVTGVKGDKESTYRRGNVNITPANIGAYTSGQVDTLLNGKQNLILSNPMMLESASYNRTETALGALATRLENTYKKQEIDSATDSLESKVNENRQTLGYTTKNLLKVTATSGSRNGISYIVNADGSVFIPGGQTANTQTDIYLINRTNIMPGDYILSGCPNGGGNDTYLLYEEISAQADLGDGKEMITDGWVKVRIVIRANYTIPSGGLTFYPMIRDASIEDDTFEPHAETVDYRLKENDDYNLLEITAESKTINGISYTIDKEAGTVTANGTATADAYIIVATLAYEDAVGKMYSASPNGGSASTYYGFIAFFASSWLANYSEYGTGLTVPVNESATTVRFEVMIRSGQTVSNLVFKPMLTKPEYSGMPFKPYKTPILRGTIDSVDAYLDYDSDIVGVEVDMEAKTVTRIAGAVGKSAGTDFNSINAFGGRKRCNLADDGTVNAYYGGSGYVEDGSNGQVMVEQPKFYYKVVPLKVDKASGKGWILRKARYYVSDKPREGFKIHPEFVRSGKVKEKVYHSAFEGSLYDVSASAYITDDAQVADFSADKLSSIANAKPMSGLSQNLTRANTRKLAENRGLGWEQLTIQVASATQLLMLIEYATFNMQQALSAGNSAKTDDGSSNMAENTGATSSLGNVSGEVTNSNGIKMFSYRGEENFYADIWKWLDGLNKLDQDVYIADHSFADDTKTGYTDAGITACNANGYIKAFCYSENFDWLFIPAEIGGDSALPVGDYYWYAAGWRVAILGGDWSSGAYGGAFYLSPNYASSIRNRGIGGRLIYIPDVDESSDKALTNEELTDRNPVSWYNASGFLNPDVFCRMYSPSSAFIEAGSTYDGESPGGRSAGDPIGLYGVEQDYIASTSQYSVNPMSFLQAKNHMSSVCYKATGTLEFLCQIGSVFFVLCNSQWALCARISTTKNASSVAVLFKSSGYDSEITLDWNAPNYQLISANNKVIRVNLLA